MNIDKELIRHWACLCESEGESIDEEVESGYFDDNGGRREYKTLTDYANSDYVARTSLVHVLSDIE